MTLQDWRAEVGLIGCHTQSTGVPLSRERAEIEGAYSTFVQPPAEASLAASLAGRAISPDWVIQIS